MACLRETPPPETLRGAGASAKAGAWYLMLDPELRMISRIEIKKNYPIFSVPIGESGDYPLTKGLCRLSYWMVEVGVDP